MKRILLLLVIAAVMAYATPALAHHAGSYSYYGPRVSYPGGYFVNIGIGYGYGSGVVVGYPYDGGYRHFSRHRGWYAYPSWGQYYPSYGYGYGYGKHHRGRGHWKNHRGNRGHGHRGYYGHSYSRHR